MSSLGRSWRPYSAGIILTVALRASAIPGEVADHEARAEEMNADLIRWVRDRSRQLDGEIMRALNLARQGVIEDVVQVPVPEGLRGTPGSQADSGAFVNRVERLMQHALHEYRDEASRKVREYRAMARNEGQLHRLVRARRSRVLPAALGLPEDSCELLGSWRERNVLVYGTPTATVRDDATRRDDAADIAPLETADGLT